MEHKGQNESFESEASDEIHQDIFHKLVEWAKKPGKRSPVAVFLYGGPGVGKTTLAYRVCAAANLRAVECNASHVRNRAGVAEVIQPLLASNNVADFFRPEGHRPLGVILDEIDGMSSGDRGGLTEIIKALKEYDGANAIFCISNEWADKKYRPLMRVCMSFEIIPPSVNEIQSLLTKKHPTIKPNAETVSELSTIHQGDLRKILQVWNSSVQRFGSSWEKSGDFKPRIESTNRISRLENLKHAVMQILSNQVDIMREVALENNDMNLAGLHLHETLPYWLKANINEPTNTYAFYRQLLHDILQSDRIDYYTFFFQYWNLFPYSYTAKLQAVNTRLFYNAVVNSRKTVKDVPMVYTAVLSRQSWLFNQFKYLGEVREFLSIHKSPCRNAGFEGAYRILLSYKERCGISINIPVWQELTQIKEMPVTERLEKWLEVLLPPEVRTIHGPKKSDLLLIPETSALFSQTEVLPPSSERLRQPAKVKSAASKEKGKGEIKRKKKVVKGIVSNDEQ
jgi:DNA polymerase III delta prime subunit